MKTKFSKLFVLLLVGLTIGSCKKEHVDDTPTQENEIQQNEKHWETTDPDTIAKITAELKKAQTEANSSTNYRNFNITYNDATPSDILPLIKREIDEIYSTDIKRTSIAKMDDIPVIDIRATSSGGMFYNGTVVITDFAAFRRVTSSTGNVVFHELIHYMHDKKISGGFNNAQNLANYDRVIKGNIYPQGSYVRSNPREYLATSAEAFFTETGRPPYNRATVQSSDKPMNDFINTNL